MNKNLWLLILSQIFAFTAAPVTVFLSGIIGSQLSPIKSLSTLPMALSIVGIAIFAMFAAKVMSIIGRRSGFIFASVGTSVASLIAAYSIIIESFILFNLGCFLIGAGVAFSHQYRFAAVETVDKEMAPKAISIILLAGIGSAFIGPNLANISKEIIPQHLYAGSYIALAILTLTSIIFLYFAKILFWRRKFTVILTVQLRIGVWCYQKAMDPGECASYLVYSLRAMARVLVCVPRQSSRMSFLLSHRRVTCLSGFSSE